jgi:hypothetical protein
MSRRHFALGGAASFGGFCLPLLSTAGLPRAALGAEPPGPLLPRRLFFENPEHGWLRMSPSGTRVAWRAPVDGVLNLWVAPTEDMGQARPLTRATDRAIGSFFAWSFDERHIVYFRERDGDENWRALSVNIETEVTVDLTPERGVRSFFLQRSRQWPSQMLIGHNGRDRSFFDAYRVDIVTGSSSLAFENREFVRLYFDSALELRFGLRTRRDGSSEIMQRKGDTWVSFMEIPIEDREATWLASIPPDRRTSYLVDSRDRDKGALFEVDLDTGNRTLLAEDSEADITQVVLHPDTERPIAARAQAARARWHIVDRSFREDFASLACRTGGFRGQRHQQPRRADRVFHRS